jgi:hypothetical protein
MPENQSGRPLQLDVAVKKIVPALKPVFTGAGVRVWSGLLRATSWTAPESHRLTFEAAELYRAFVQRRATVMATR